MFIKLICTILVIKALKRNGKYVNIQEVMDQWTLQMGYPVITILGNTTAENRIIITQQHFIYDISAKTKALELQNNRYNNPLHEKTIAFIRIFHFAFLTFYKGLPNTIIKCK